MNKVILSPAHHNQIERVVEWCHANAGPGSMRFRTNTWLGTDDWFCYSETPGEQIDDEEDSLPQIQLQDVDSMQWIFAFRHEETAVLFSLHWC